MHKREIAEHLSRNSAAQTDAVIRGAILSYTGQGEIVLDDVRRLGIRKIMPDGSEIFAYDGVDLVQFWPIETKVYTEENAAKLRVSRKYSILI